jgi:hypothetical protein
MQAAQYDGVSAARAVPLSNIQPVLVTVTPVLTPLQQWRQNNFGTWQSTGSAANDADPNGDGLPNIMEYVMGRDPNSGANGFIGSNPLEVTFVNRDTPVFVDLRLISNYDSKVRLTIQNSTNMQSWSTLTMRTGTGAWTISPASTTLLNGGGRTWFRFGATVIPANAWKQFFRVKAEELP